MYRLVHCRVGLPAPALGFSPAAFQFLITLLYRSRITKSSSTGPIVSFGFTAAFCSLFVWSCSDGFFRLDLVRLRFPSAGSGSLS